MALANTSITSRFGAKILPALELRDGVPVQLRTLVVVPTMLTSLETLAAHLERLEIHHLASLDGDLSFALLSDWADAAAERVAGDDTLLDAAVEGVARLNRQYGPAPAGERFLLLHRRRLWNPAQGVWMGWERKRGKLHELNRLLRGATDTSFVAAGGKPPASSGRRALRGHARCRYATAQGRRAPPRRQDGASTQCRRGSTKAADVCSRGMRCCSRESHPRCRSGAKDPSINTWFRAPAASTRMPRPCRTCTRTFAARDPTSARASMTWTHSRRHSPVACPTTRC